MTASPRALWLVVSTAVRVSPAQSLLCLTETLGIVFRLMQPLFISWFAGGVVTGDHRRVATAASALVVSSVLRLALNFVGVNARIGQLERVGYAFGNQVAETTARIPTLDHLESPHYLDQIQTIRDQEWSLGLAANMLLNSVNNLVMVGGTIALASTADRRLLLIGLAGVPAVVAARWFVRWGGAAEDAAAQPGRLAAHLLSLGLEPASGAELRLFELRAEMRERLRTAGHAWRAPFVGLARRRSAVQVAGTLFFFGTAIAVLAWMLHDVLTGAEPLATMVLALMLIGRLQSIGDVMQRTIGNLSQVVRTAGRILWLLDHERETASLHTGDAPPPAALRTGIRLRDVSHRYDEAARPALDEVSLDLPAGSVVALVGENGAGKSTLVKLLCGLYRPTAGRVLIDGRDLREFDLIAWRARLSGAFQDHMRFELTAARSVAVGDLGHLDDPVRLATALERGAATDILATLPDGPATQLGSVWPGGVDLSAGQWQRLALARGMMRERPLLLVLDEPTAALDAHAEHLLFERYTAAALSGERDGSVTLLVTHRFSTVAAADLIIVLDRGRVVEQGTHRELVEAGGQYARLFELQARGYR